LVNFRWRTGLPKAGGGGGAGESICHMKSSSSDWSGRVTRESHALALEKGVFTWDDPARIARSLMKSAEASTARSAPPFRSAMSMLVFYINRAGKKLPPERKQTLEQAKEELRRLYDRKTRN